MPSNHNYVCFECRINLRRSKVASEAPRCPSCGNECSCLGYKIPIPPRHDERAWSELLDQSREQALRTLADRREENVRLVHELERQIVELSRRPSNPGRERTLSELRSRLAEAKRFSGGF